MKLLWQASKQEAVAVRKWIKERESDPFVKRRVAKNLANKTPDISRERFWEVLIGCLLTSQQRSGPGSRVNLFLTNKPFPLSLDIVRSTPDSAQFVTSTLQSWGGIRFAGRLGRFAAENLERVLSERWPEIDRVLARIAQERTRSAEIQAADLLRDLLLGIGPKQSRNLLQGLGLSRYEIPLDSRIVDWLNKNNFPYRLSAASLGDPDYYLLASDGIQVLCEAADVYPCVLDAAIFSSYDQGGWTEANLFW